MKTFSRLEAAEFLKCDKSVVSALAATGAIPCARIGRRMVFIEDDLAAYLRQLVDQQTARVRAVQAVIFDASLVTPPKRGRPRRIIDFSRFEEALAAVPNRVLEPAPQRRRPRLLSPKITAPKG